MFQSRSACIYGPLVSLTGLENQTSSLSKMASVGILSMNAKNLTASINRLYDGDQLLIYKQSSFGRMLQTEQRNEYLRNVWGHMQDQELFDERMSLTQEAQTILNKSVENFFYGFGFLKKERNVPCADKIRSSPTYTAKVEFSLPKEKDISISDDPKNIFTVAQKKFLQEQIFSTRHDILYQGTVELDDVDYDMEIETPFGTDPFTFHGLQKGFMPSTWGCLLYSGHQSLVIRPEPGIA